MKVFIDSDVILDVLQKRQGYEHSLKIIEYIENQKVRAYTSPVALTNIFYIVSKLENKNKSLVAIRKIRKIIKIANVNEQIVDSAINSDFKDFEDAVQYFSAINCGCIYLITRNTNDYVGQEVNVVSPKEFISLIELN